MHVLYLHPARTYGGASKSLIELYLSAKKNSSIQAWVLTPGGSAAEAFRDAGMNVVETYGLAQFDHTRFGYYRNVRWLILLRELFLIPFSIYSILRLKRLKIPFDLVHVNEITLLPTAILAKLIFKLPIIFHVRSLQCVGYGVIRSRLIFKILKMYAAAVICIDETVRASIPRDIESVVIHNVINFNSAPTKDNSLVRSEVCVGMAGVLHRSKGVYEFLEAAKILVKDRGFNARFLLAGENAREASGIKKWIYSKLGFSEDILAISKKYVEENNMSEHVTFKGLIRDIREFYPLIDILCFPSHLNACGRPVFEAAFFGIPSIVAIENPIEDAIIDGLTGVAISQSNSQMLADAIESLIIDRAKITLMGSEAKFWAEKFYSIKTNSALLNTLYLSKINNSSN